MMKNSIPDIFMLCLGLFFFCAFCPVNAEAALDEVKVAVLPFDISSAGPFSYVGPAAEEVLISRLASERIFVMDSFEIQRMTDKRQGLISPLNAGDIAGKLGVDYVVAGKVKAEGENITIDMNLLQVDSESPIFSLVFSPASLDEVPSRMEDFATQAANRILNGPKSVTAESGDRGGQKAPQKLQQEETAQDEDLMIARMHPDRLIPALPDKKSYTHALPVMPPEPLLPAPASTLSYPPPETETIEEQVAATPQTSSAEQPIPADGPIWQWY